MAENKAMKFEPVPDADAGFEDSPESVQRRLAREGKVRLKIEQTTDESAPSEVFVGVNGYGFKIRRGEWVEVPRSVLRVLQEQTKRIYRVTHDDQGHQTLTPVDVPAHPYQAQEIAA